MYDEFEDEGHDGLIDDDPALDYILYQEMEKENKGSQGKGAGGCLSLMLFLLIPPAGFYLYFDLLL